MKARSLLSLCLTLVAAPSVLAQSIPTRQDIINQMNQAAASYPAICDMVDLNARFGTPLTHGGRRIYALKISDNVTVDEDEEAFLMVGAHHGNEYGTPIVGLDTISRLTTGYGVDPTITNLVDNREIWIAPLWNQDGYSTSRYNSNPVRAVDLNRNYPFLWSSSCNYSSRKGASPGSEPETLTMIALSESQRFTKVIDFHSSGRETLYGYRSGCGQHVLGAYLQSEAIALSQASSYGGQVRGPSSNGEHYQWQLGNFSNYAFLTEISNTQSPTYSSAVAEATRLWPGTVWMLQRPIPVWGHVTDAVSGAPVEANITYVQNPFTLGERNRSEPGYGRYHAFLPNGNHTLRFEHPRYLTQEIPVTVTSSGVHLAVALAPLSASCTTRNGTGINPSDFTCTTAPVLGTHWLSSIATNATTLGTYVAVSGLRNLGPPTYLYGGEVLIHRMPSPTILSGMGTHSVAVPLNNALLGATFATQGLRVDSPGGVPNLVLLNAQDLVLGF